MVRVAGAAFISGAVGCATASPVEGDTRSTAPSGEPDGTGTPASEALDGEFFVSCGNEPVALFASGGRDPLPLGFVERPAQVRAGARRGEHVSGAVSSSLGVIQAWLPVDRLGWYTAEEVQLAGAPVVVPAGQRVCRRDGGSPEAPRVYVETRLGEDWIAHEHTARVDVAREDTLGWTGTLPRASLGHLPPPRRSEPRPSSGLREFAEGALPVLLTEPLGVPLLTARRAPGPVRVTSERDGGAWVRVGWGPYVVGFTATPLARADGSLGSNFGMGGLGLSGTGRNARARLARESLPWPIRRVAPSAGFVTMGGQTLTTPEVSYARVGPLHSMGRHTVLLATDDGFLLVGWLQPESLVDEPTPPAEAH